jgi:hypothetical protein
VPEVGNSGRHEGNERVLNKAAEVLPTRPANRDRVNFDTSTDLYIERIN